MQPDNNKEIYLHEISHARAGDKGNRLNIALFSYEPEHYPLLIEQVTEARVMELFQHRGASSVKRYELPNLHCLNFVIEDVLEGGVNGALNLDGHGKTLSYRLLSLRVVMTKTDHLSQHQA